MLATALLLSTLLAAPDAGTAAPVKQVTQRQERAMGPVTVTLLVREDVDPAKAFEAVWAAMDRVERVMNEWRPDSPLSELNRKAGDGEWVRLPPDLHALLARSLAAAKRTEGRFDPTWASLRGLWRFGTGQTGEVPPDAELDRRCAAVDFEAVELAFGPKGPRARITRKETQLGLGGAAKGWAVDRAAEALRARGFTDFWIQAGGDFYASGQEAGGPWVVGIRDPRGAREESFAALALSDAAFSTSGDYERFFVKDGIRYHHLIDPRTCRPARGARSVSVLARSALEAEFLTKAAFVAGGAEGLALIDRAGALGVIVDAENRVHVSKGLEGKLQLRRPTP